MHRRPWAGSQTGELFHRRFIVYIGEKDANLRNGLENHVWKCLQDEQSTISWFPQQRYFQLEARKPQPAGHSFFV